jgi:Flp pilus assembly protein TadD
MKHITLFILVLTFAFSFSQEENKALLLAAKKANNFVYEGNELVENDDYVAAEMEYRKAISEQPTTTAAVYNLGTSYYKSGNLAESLYRLQQAAKTATSKPEKHNAFHNIGNLLMQNKKCKEAVEAYKNALRNDPSDDETRYNLGVAKKCAEEQQDQDDQNQDDKQDKDKQDENKENQDKENQDNKDKEGENEDKKDEGDEDKKEGEDEKDEEGKPKDEKKDEGKGDEDKKKEQPKPQPQPGQLSPQQIKNLLEAMNNQEQKVQEKMNAEKEKGVKIKTDKDW